MKRLQAQQIWTDSAGLPISLFCLNVATIEGQQYLRALCPLYIHVSEGFPEKEPFTSPSEHAWHAHGAPHQEGKPKAKRNDAPTEIAVPTMNNKSGVKSCSRRDDLG